MCYRRNYQIKKIIVFLFLMLVMSTTAFAENYDLKSVGIKIELPPGFTYPITRNNFSEKVAKETGIPYETLQEEFNDQAVEMIAYNIPERAVIRVMVQENEHSKDIKDFRSIKKSFTDSKFYDGKGITNFKKNVEAHIQGAEISNIGKQTSKDAILILFDMVVSAENEKQYTRNYHTVKRSKLIWFQGTAFYEDAFPYVKDCMKKVMDSAKYDQSDALEKSFFSTSDNGASVNAGKDASSSARYNWSLIVGFVGVYKLIFKKLREHEEEKKNSTTKDISDDKNDTFIINDKKLAKKKVDDDETKLSDTEDSSIEAKKG